eukprot:XP_001705764.1 Hypothetical protein GL50803_20235 [Giardia lamblia ATCC 50803]
MESTIASVIDDPSFNKNKQRRNVGISTSCCNDQGCLPSIVTFSSIVVQQQLSQALRSHPGRNHQPCVPVSCSPIIIQGEEGLYLLVVLAVNGIKPSSFHSEINRVSGMWNPGCEWHSVKIDTAS